MHVVYAPIPVFSYHSSCSSHRQVKPPRAFSLLPAKKGRLFGHSKESAGRQTVGRWAKVDVLDRWELKWMALVLYKQGVFSTSMLVPGRVIHLLMIVPSSLKPLKVQETQDWFQRGDGRNGRVEHAKHAQHAKASSHQGVMEVRGFHPPLCDPWSVGFPLGTQHATPVTHFWGYNSDSAGFAGCCFSGVEKHHLEYQGGPGQLRLEGQALVPVRLADQLCVAPGALDSVG